MSRKLIDRDALIASIPKTNVDIFENCRNCSTLCDWQVRELIEQAELVDAVEVVHGEWKNKYMDYSFDSLRFECSKCGKLSDGRTKYCAFCGAKMDGERRDNGQIQQSN